MHLNFLSLLLAGFSLLAVMSSSAQAEDIFSSQASDQGDWSRPQQEEQGKDWKFEVGGGVIFGPKYEGSDNYTANPLPHASVDYKDGLFFAGPFDGIGSYPIRGENYKVGAALGVSFGRSEDDDKDNLRGMGDIDLSPTVSLMGEYDIFGPVKLSGTVAKGNEDFGIVAEADIGTMFLITEKVMFMGKVGAKWADEDHTNTYFGVTSTQSARSGYAQYQADAGFQSVGVKAGAFYSITENWDAMLMLSGDQLIRDAVDSPLVKQEFQPATILTIGYKF